jgi:ABC-type nitrate/sulfonate/bicarbonate transport system permease component
MLGPKEHILKYAASIWHLALPLITLALIWEALARSGWFPPLLLPHLSEIFQQGYHLIISGILLNHLLASLARLLSGFAIGALFGLALGVAMGLSAWAERFFSPLLNIFLPIPSVALVPLFVLWFGLGSLAVVLLTAFISGLQVTFNTWTGVKSADVKLLRVGQSMNATLSTRIWKIVLPSALPTILAGLRLALARGWIATVAGELVAGTEWGLGWMIYNALQYLKTPTMLVGLVTIGLVGLVIEKIIFEPIEACTVVRWGMVQER